MISRPRRRLRFQPIAIAGLTLVWLLLVNKVTLFSLLGGMLLAWLVTVIFPLTPIHWPGRLHPWGAVRLLAVLLRDLAVSSVRLAIAAFAPRMPASGIVRVALTADVDLYQVNVAELVSIVPGTIVVDARPKKRRLYLHVFGMTSPADAEAVREATLAVERRVLAAIGSRDEQRAARKEQP